MKIYKCCDIESVTKKVYCSSCGNEVSNEFEVSGDGIVYSHTLIHVASTEYAKLAPYTVALVQLNNTTAKLTVRMDEKVEIGDVVQPYEIIDGGYIYKKLA